MKQLTISRDGQITHGPSSFPSDSELQEHLAKHIGMGTYGAPDSYEVLIEDVTDKAAQEKTNSEALQFLAESDWRVIKATELGEEIPEELKAQRAAARASIVRIP